MILFSYWQVSDVAKYDKNVIGSKCTTIRENSTRSVSTAMTMPLDLQITGAASSLGIKTWVLSCVQARSAMQHKFSYRRSDDEHLSTENPTTNGLLFLSLEQWKHTVHGADLGVLRGQ